MVHILKRARNLRQLLWIRNGPGAIQLPKEVTKIHLEFHPKLIGSAFRGARHFWHEMMPRMKYRNPTVPMSVTRHKDPNGGAYLHIYTSTATPASSQTTNPPGTANASPEASNTLTPDTTEPTHTFEIKTLHESEILDLLVEKTGAVVLRTPPEEAQEMEEFKEFEVRAEKDRIEVRERLLRERREAQLLKLARGEVPNAA
ncbi:hypothetical protein BU23DRAFT_587197 [Bimuria novae-zelandiae CBS 107.79]|uniref:Uncharacterized protein n=1 Tax=Bimuria novae-zelandiae CBS 107.79 TaxID=1447943 RepID=A0A6A5VYJ9_9PLEO|nr:hypothetical protein BU23DRAFT_587197 [Bimuria novae-zelandiae CBS 107.79]